MPGCGFTLPRSGCSLCRVEATVNILITLKLVSCRRQPDQVCTDCQNWLYRLEVPDLENWCIKLAAAFATKPRSFRNRPLLPAIPLLPFIAFSEFCTTLTVQLASYLLGKEVTFETLKSAAFSLLCLCSSFLLGFVVARPITLSCTHLLSSVRMRRDITCTVHFSYLLGVTSIFNLWMDHRLSADCHCKRFTFWPMCIIALVVISCIMTVNLFSCAWVKLGEVRKSGHSSMLRSYRFSNSLDTCWQYWLQSQLSYIVIYLSLSFSGLSIFHLVVVNKISLPISTTLQFQLDCLLHAVVTCHGLIPNSVAPNNVL